MAEFLPRFGWQPVFVAPLNGYYGRAFRLDNNLLQEVEKYPVYRTDFFYPFNNRNSSLFARFVRRMWEFFWLPDGKRNWNRSVKKMLPEIIEEHQPDVVLITSTPFSTFLLAPYIKKKFGLPVVLDYRDPWTESPIVERNRLKARLAEPLERRAIKSADLLTAASYRIVDYVSETVGGDARDKTFFGFPYGYNGEMFRREILQRDEPTEGDRLTGTFAGFVHGDISSEVILEGIRQALRMDEELGSRLEIKCFGTLFGSSENPDKKLEAFGLCDHVILRPFLPYKDFLKTLRDSSFLILPHGASKIAKVLYPTKFFDYLGVRRPILYIGGRGQVWETVEACNAGICVEPDSLAVAEALIRLKSGSGKEAWYTNDEQYRKLDRAEIFSDLSNILHEIMDGVAR